MLTKDPDAPDWPRVPPEVARYAGRPAMLDASQPGKRGVLRLRFERVGASTELAEHYQQPPLHFTRPLHIDPHRPGMAFGYLMTTGGGVVQADRYRLDVRVGPAAEVHLTTQAATKVHGMDADYAAQQVVLRAEAGAYLEYLPEPLIPFARARFHQRTELTVDQDATVVLGETVLAGRLGRGERHAYQALALDLEVRRPDGRLLAVENTRLDPTGACGPAVLGGHDRMSTLLVITDAHPASDLADAAHQALTARAPDGCGVWHGVSVLPAGCGVRARVLGSDAGRTAAAVHAVWDAVRRLLIRAPAPDLRKP